MNHSGGWNSKGHVVLLGDSIFDNARYDPDRPPVIDQLRHALPREWRASLLGRDGHIAEDVVKQLKDLPPDATHLVVSAGGNDALGEIAILGEPSSTVGEALEIINEVRAPSGLMGRWGMILSQGALARPWAVLSNRFAVKEDGSPFSACPCQKPFAEPFR
jgi:hypothetical protein